MLGSSGPVLVLSAGEKEEGQAVRGAHKQWGDTVPHSETQVNMLGAICLGDSLNI